MTKPATTSAFFDSRCANPLSMDALNEYCFCVSVDPAVLQGALSSVLQAHGVSSDLADTHSHLFAALPVYVSRDHLRQVDEAVATIDSVTGTTTWRNTVLGWAPSIAAYDPGSPGGMLGLDFHLTPAGPRLIEINTNPGGALLNTLMGQAQVVCMPKVVTAPIDAEAAEREIVEVFQTEWALQRGELPLTTIAIVDESPQAQYLYPEFLLFKELFSRHGLRAVICAPEDLAHRDGKLVCGDAVVDMVYNRLTDFALELPGHVHLRDAYLSGHVALSPHPRAHAVYADKRNLAMLGSEAFLMDAGATKEIRDVLQSVVPVTELVTPGNRDELWTRRRELFFKPAAGYGSKASYRGDKLTRRVWGEIAAGTYIAQVLVPPSERRIGTDGTPLKADIRCYAYQGTPLLYAARLYQGQTTNFRTPGGGFAPVLTAVS
ncbi:hypothetical protein GCM10028795_19500 [Lysobacter olei]